MGKQHRSNFCFNKKCFLKNLGPRPNMIAAKHGCKLSHRLTEEAEKEGWRGKGNPTSLGKQSEISLTQGHQAHPLRRKGRQPLLKSSIVNACRGIAPARSHRSVACLHNIPSQALQAFIPPKSLWGDNLGPEEQYHCPLDDTCAVLRFGSEPFSLV